MLSQYPWEQFEAINENLPQKQKTSVIDFIINTLAFWVLPYLALIITD